MRNNLLGKIKTLMIFNFIMLLFCLATILMEIFICKTSRDEYLKSLTNYYYIIVFIITFCIIFFIEVLFLTVKKSYMKQVRDIFLFVVALICLIGISSIMEMCDKSVGVNIIIYNHIRLIFAVTMILIFVLIKMLLKVNIYKNSEKIQLITIFCLLVMIAAFLIRVLILAVAFEMLPPKYGHPFLVFIYSYYHTISLYIIRIVALCVFLHLIICIVIFLYFKSTILQRENNKLILRNMDWQTIICHRIGNLLSNVESDAAQFELNLTEEEDLSIVDREKLIDIINEDKRITVMLFNNIYSFDSLMDKMLAVMDDNIYNRNTWNLNSNIRNIINSSIAYNDISDDEINASIVEAYDYGDDYTIRFSEKVMQDVFNEIFFNSATYKKPETLINIESYIIANKYISFFDDDFSMLLFNKKILYRNDNESSLMVSVSNIVDDTDLVNINKIANQFEIMKDFWKCHLSHNKSANDFDGIRNLPFGLVFITYCLINMDCIPNYSLYKNEDNDYVFNLSFSIPVYLKRGKLV